MQFLIGLCLGLILSYFLSYKVPIRNDVNLECPKIDQSPEISRAFEVCQKSLDDRVNKLFDCQSKSNEYQIRIHDLENEKTRPLNNDY